MVDPKRLLAKNIFSNWLGLVLTAGVAFYLNPFLVDHLGKDQFGIWALCFSILAYTDFFDIGVRQSLARYLPKYFGVGDYDNMNRVINTGNFIYGVVGTMTLILSAVAAFFFVDLFNVPEELIEAMRWTLLIVGVNAAVVFYTMACTALGPFHRYDLLNAIGMTFKILETAAIIYFLSIGYELIALALIVFAATTAKLGVSRITQQRIVPQIRFGVKFISKAMGKEMISYGMYSLLIVIATIVIFNTDNIVIGIFVSTEAVAYYAIALTVMQYLRNIVQTAGVPLITSISHMEATGGIDEVGGMSRKMMKYLFFLCTSFCCSVIIFGDVFVELWMGPGFEQTVTILWILAAPAIIYLPQATSNSILFGIGKHKLLFYVVAGEALANIVLSLILVQYHGIVGVALGTAIPQLIIYGSIYPYYYHRALKADLKQFYSTAVAMMALGGLVTVPIAMGMRELMVIDTWLEFCLGALGVIVAFGAGFILIVLDKEDRVWLWAKLKRKNVDDINTA